MLFDAPSPAPEGKPGSLAGGFLSLESRLLVDMVKDKELVYAKACNAAAHFHTTDIRIGAIWSHFVLCSELLKLTLDAAFHHGLQVHVLSLHGLEDQRRWPLAGQPCRSPTTDPYQAVAEEIIPMLDSLGTTINSFCKVPTGIFHGNLASDIASLAPKVGADTKTLLEVAGVSKWWTGTRRRSCCLYYRAPDTQKCGDCAIR